MTRTPSPLAMNAAAVVCLRMFRQTFARAVAVRSQPFACLWCGRGLSIPPTNHALCRDLVVQIVMGTDGDSAGGGDGADPLVTPSSFDWQTPAKEGSDNPFVADDGGDGPPPPLPPSLPAKRTSPAPPPPQEAAQPVLFFVSSMVWFNNLVQCFG
jgi:hypothetical protein